MSEKLAQAAPANGASSATDFQPPTQNPQTAPVNVQQQSGLQDITNTQEFLHEQQGVRISVTSEPAPAQAAVQPTNDAIGLVLLAAIVVLAAVVLYKVIKKQRLGPVAAVAEQPAVEPQKLTEEIEPAMSAAKTKKSDAKRKAAKKAKRRRR
jgi:hypothetical protein